MLKYIHMPSRIPLRHIEEGPQDDPRRMSPSQIRAYAKQNGLHTIAEIAHQALRANEGRTAMTWPEPLQQQGISCQTVAVINGVRCYQAANQGSTWNPNFAEIAEVRREAGRLEGRAEALNAGSVARLFVSRGLLASAIEMWQPIKAVEVMAGYNGFAVVTSSDAWHDTTVVPNLARLATPSKTVPDLIAIDSLGGQQTGMSVEEFCAIMLEQDWQREDKTLVCTV